MKIYLGLVILLIIVSCTSEQPLEEIPNDWMFRQRAYPSGKIDKTAYLQALSFRKAALAKPSIQTRNDNDWQLAGPTNIGGRITDLEMLSDNLKTIFAATASGGIFRSDDLGVNWSPIFDETGVLSIGDMAFAPSNERIIYVGTGEANAGGNSLAYDGLGVYKSTDQGANWQHLGLEDAGSIGKVLVAPDNPDLVYVAAMGTLFANNTDRGVYRSKDGGNTWEQVLYISSKTGAIDLAIHPEDNDIIYAAMWERVRRPDNRAYGGSTSGIYRSTDGGDNWDELTNGLPATANQKGRIGIAISKSSPNILYANYARGDNGQLEGVYRTEDGGNTWGRINSEEITSVPFMWWFGKIFINPNDPDNVILTSLQMFESVNGGANWRFVGPEMHVDQHAVFIHPQNVNFRVFGNDGGVYLQNLDEVSVNSVRHLINTPITQFYTCAIDFQNPERLFGGTQDNGTLRTVTGAVDNWDKIFGGDGFSVLIDPTDSDIVYAQSQFGNLGRSLDGGNTFKFIKSGFPASSRFNWSMPTVFEPGDPSTLYIGSERVLRTENRGDQWTVISPDLTKGSGEGNLQFGTLTSISVSSVNTNIIYTGADDGSVHVSKDRGFNWINVDNRIPDRWITSVHASPLDESTAYLTLSGYRFGKQEGHVYKTKDFGESWTDISGNLPDIPVNDIIQNPTTGLLYLATDIGVFQAGEDGANWALLGNALPNVVVSDLKLHVPTQMLVVATYGRSLYKINLEATTSTSKVEDPRLSLLAYPNPFKHNCWLEIKSELEEEAEIQLFDSDGQLLSVLFTGKFSKNRQVIELELEGLPSGTYFAQLNSERINKTIRLLKQ